MPRRSPSAPHLRQRSRHNGCCGHTIVLWHWACCQHATEHIPPVFGSRRKPCTQADRILGMLQAGVPMCASMWTESVMATNMQMHWRQDMTFGPCPRQWDSTSCSDQAALYTEHSLVALQCAHTWENDAALRKPTQTAHATKGGIRQKTPLKSTAWSCKDRVYWQAGEPVFL